MAQRFGSGCGDEVCGFTSVEPLCDEGRLASFCAKEIEGVARFGEGQEVVSKGFERGDLVWIKRKRCWVREPRFLGEEVFWAVEFRAVWWRRKRGHSRFLRASRTSSSVVGAVRSGEDFARMPETHLCASTCL